MRIELKHEDELDVTLDRGGQCFVIRAKHNVLQIIKRGQHKFDDRVIWTSVENPGTCENRNYYTGCTLIEGHKGPHKDFNGSTWDP